MKMYILAAILLLSGLAGITNSDSSALGGGIIAMITGAIIIAVKLIKRRDKTETAGTRTISPSIQFQSTPYQNNTVEEEPIRRDKNLIPDGYLTDVNGTLIPLGSVHSPFSPEGLMRIDNNYYEITSAENIGIAKDTILSLNRCLNEAAAMRNDLPPHRFSSGRLNFKFDPYAFTRDYCMLSFHRSGFMKNGFLYECTLHVNYSDSLPLFGDIIYDQNGCFKKAKIISHGRTPQGALNVFRIIITASENGNPILKSARTTAEIELERQQKSQAWDSIHKKWGVIIDEHARLMKEIGVAYTIANNLNMPDSPQMQHVIELCKKDIALAEMFQKSQDEIQQVRIANGWADASEPTKSITTFPTFKRLAIIYEKQKDYENAIAVCQRAIELGYPDDGTDGQMPGRIARLMRKTGNQKKKLSTPETIDSTFGDDSDSPDASAQI